MRNLMKYKHISNQVLFKTNSSFYIYSMGSWTKFVFVVPAVFLVSKYNIGRTYLACMSKVKDLEAKDYYSTNKSKDPNRVSVTHLGPKELAT